MLDNLSFPFTSTFFLTNIKRQIPKAFYTRISILYFGISIYFQNSLQCNYQGPTIKLLGKYPPIYAQIRILFVSTKNKCGCLILKDYEFVFKFNERYTTVTQKYKLVSNKSCVFNLFNNKWLTLSLEIQKQPVRPKIYNICLSTKQMKHSLFEMHVLILMAYLKRIEIFY